jgi:UDP-N-acetylmuramoyl-tripeptide--D-alanyl-D-alanine ligase
MLLSDIYTIFLQSKGIATDTRKIKEGSLYFALKGENFDGNKFAQDALDKGASFAIIDTAEFQTSDSYILVDNVLETLQQLSKLHREKLALPIIALTGSNGKTTTKELVNVVLSKKHKTVATVGNLNNHIGVPLTLLSMDATTEIGIVEMGANHLKEIEFLSSIAKPNFGYITNFGKAHLEGFGGFEGVIKGKTELYTYLKNNKGQAFVNTTDSLQIKQSKQLETILFGNTIKLNQVTPFVVVADGDMLIKTNLIGHYNFNNIMVAIAIGKHFNIPLDAIKNALETYTPTNNRSQIIEKGNSKIILDAYNANPSSMELALENFNNLKENDKIVFLGDMFELGETSIQEHQFIADLANSYNFKEVHLIGEHFSKTKASKAMQYISFEAFKTSFNQTPNSCLLIKGSRGMALERILDLIL